MNLKNKKYFIELLHKLYDGSITKTELEELSYFFINNQKIKVWPEQFGSKKEIEKRIFHKIQADIYSESHNTNKTVPLYKRAIFKYAVAASITLLISLTFILNNDKSPTTITPMTVDNNIEPGADRAILTLEDGSTVELDQTTSYQNQNVNSNGKQLVYGSKRNNSDQITYNYLTIPRGGEYLLILSDSTKVWLNSESQLKYPVSFIKGQTRQVELIYGEAYFEVTPSTKHNGAKFKVINKYQEVEVLGTEFNIKAYENDYEVFTTLVEGKVSVNFENEQQNLQPSQQAKWNTSTNSLTVKTIDVYNEISWRYGLFSFEEGKPLREIMKVLSRWYDVDIVFENKSIEDIEFVGVLRKNRNLEEIIRNIKNFGIIKEYEINDKKVILK